MSTMNLTLHVWRQKDRASPGSFVTYKVVANEHMSFLEMLDVLNESLVAKGEDPIAFEHDCREGICGMCGFMINGVAHGDQKLSTVCQTHMRVFTDGDELTLEPWRSAALPVLKDLIVERAALDRMVAAGGYISANTGSAPDGNALPVPKFDADKAFDAAACIGCAACVAACPNGSAALFCSAKIAHLGRLPQGQPERWSRARDMVQQMDAEGFGHCTMHGECEAVCPKGISVSNIARMNRDFLVGGLFKG